MIRAGIVLVLVGALVFTACSQSPGTDDQVVDEDLAASIETLTSTLNTLLLALDTGAPADTNHVTDSIEALKAENQELSNRVASLESMLLEISVLTDAGDNWQDIREAATPEMRHSVQLHAECRAGEWSHPGGTPVHNESGLDEVGHAVAAGIEESTWRGIAFGRLPNSQAAVIQLIDRTHDWPHCALEGLYTD